MDAPLEDGESFGSDLSDDAQFDDEFNLPFDSASISSGLLADLLSAATSSIVIVPLESLKAITSPPLKL